MINNREKLRREDAFEDNITSANTTAQVYQNTSKDFFDFSIELTITFECIIKISFCY